MSETEFGSIPTKIIFSSAVPYVFFILLADIVNALATNRHAIDAQKLYEVAAEGNLRSKGRDCECHNAGE